jgi:hypothetical protein
MHAFSPYNLKNSMHSSVRLKHFMCFLLLFTGVIQNNVCDVEGEIISRGISSQDTSAELRDSEAWVDPRLMSVFKYRMQLMPEGYYGNTIGYCRVSTCPDEAIVNVKRLAPSYGTSANGINVPHRCGDVHAVLKPLAELTGDTYTGGNIDVLKPIYSLRDQNKCIMPRAEAATQQMVSDGFLHESEDEKIREILKPLLAFTNKSRVVKKLVENSATDFDVNFRDVEIVYSTEKKKITKRKKFQKKIQERRKLVKDGQMNTSTCIEKQKSTSIGQKLLGPFRKIKLCIRNKFTNEEQEAKDSADVPVVMRKKNRFSSAIRNLFKRED